jgi:hypothetical protein
MNLDEYIQNLERAGGKTISQGPDTSAQLQQTRQQLEQALIPQTAVTPSFPTSLPEAGGLLLGLVPFAAPETKFAQSMARIGEKAPAVVRPYIPSLAASTIGATAGTITEQALLPDQQIFSTETGKKLLENNLQNAAFDVGGNLVFTAFGKTLKIGKDMLDKTGITKSSSFFATPEQEARRAAQEWLSSRNATLTRGQLTGDFGTQAVEGTLKFSPASTYFEQQQKAVKEALNAGANDVKTTLETSQDFQNALRQGDPTQMAIGDRLQNAISEADKLMKAKFAPVYEKIDADQGLKVNLIPLKQQAQKDLDKLARTKFVGASDDKRKVLEDILKQDDEVTFGVAHDLRSNFLASGREATKEGVPSTVLQKEYFNQAQGIANQMDNIMVLTFGNEEEKAIARKMGLVGGIDQPAGLRNGQYIGNNFASIDAMNIGRTKATTANNDLLREYFNAQNGYKNAMTGLYSGTMQAALKAEPSAVGEMLFNIDRPERMRDTFKAIAEVQKYLPKEQSTGLVNELRYGYLNKIFGDPSGILKLSQNLEDKTFKEGFDYLFREPQVKKQLLEITNAAKYGLEEAAGSTVLRTKAIGAAVTGTTAGASTLAYLNLPEEVKNKLDLPSILSSAGVLYLTPKMMGRALTNKNSMDTLAMLAKAQANPKYAGAAATKIADMLNKSGIIDSDYLNEVNQMMSIPREQTLTQQQKQNPVIDLDAYIKSLEKQPTQ